MLDKQIQNAWIRAQRTRKRWKEIPGLTTPRWRFRGTLRDTRTRSSKVYRETWRRVMMWFEKKAIPRQTSDHGPDPLSRFLTTEYAENTEREHRFQWILFPCVLCIPWFPALRRQERVCGRGNAVSCGRQYRDGLEEPEPTHRNDATAATRRRLRLAGRSHLSPDGGCFTRAAVHRLAADGYDEP
jgi:hypothetical protein